MIPEEIEDVNAASSTAPLDAKEESTVQTPGDSSVLDQNAQPLTPPSQDGVNPEPEEDKQVDRVARRVTQFIAPQLKQMLEERLSQQTYQPQQTAPQTQAPTQ